MDLDAFTKTIMAGSALMILLIFVVSFSLVGLTLWALIDCIDRKHGDERLKWVLVITVIPPLGAVIYFAKRRPRTSSQVSPNGLQNTAKAPRQAPPDEWVPPFDINEMQDPKKCAASINAALDAMAASRRRK